MRRAGGLVGPLRRPAALRAGALQTPDQAPVCRLGGAAPVFLVNGPQAAGSRLCLRLPDRLCRSSLSRSRPTSRQVCRLRGAASVDPDNDPQAARSRLCLSLPARLCCFSLSRQRPASHQVCRLGGAASVDPANGPQAAGSRLSPILPAWTLPIRSSPQVLASRRGPGAGPARHVWPAEPRLAVHCDLLGMQRAGGPLLSALALFTVAMLVSRAHGAREPALLVKSGPPDYSSLHTVPSSACNLRAAVQARCDIPLLSKLSSWTPGTTEQALLIKSGLPGHASTCTLLSLSPGRLLLRTLAPPGPCQGRLATRLASPTSLVWVAASDRVLPGLRLTVSKDF
jgi:hypothetical protein